MRTVGAYEAKTHLSALLDAVERGETIEITRHGKPIARLGPSEDARVSNNRHVMEELRRLRSQPGWPKLTREEIVDLIHQGREERDQAIERALGWRE